MKIAIFGRHPTPQPGFMGVMSLYEAKYFSLLGNDVDLLIPFASPADYHDLCQRCGINSFDELDRFGGSFSILPVFTDGTNFEKYDALVYQSYDAWDEKNFFQMCRTNCNILTKNFPKWVTGSNYASNPSVTQEFSTYDLIACSLQDDIQELRSDRLWFNAIKHKIAYVPRGADETLLHPGKKVGQNPVIGIDIPPSESGIAAIAHYLEALKKLIKRRPDVQIMALGEQDLHGLPVEQIAYGPFSNIYESFFNHVSIYLVMDYSKSPAHVRAPVQAIHPKDWSGRAIYEVQNIEAQMSGALLFGHEKNMIPELYSPGVSGFNYERFDDSEEIAYRLEKLVEIYPACIQQTRQFALRNFKWSDCIRRWNSALLRMQNGSIDSQRSSVSIDSHSIPNAQASKQIRSVRKGNNSKLLNDILVKNPYESFDYESWPHDLQGWGSDHPILPESVAALNPHLIVEVGSWKGASAIAFARKVRELSLSTSIICVDTWLGGRTHFSRKESTQHYGALKTSHGYPQLYYQFLANIMHSEVEDIVVPMPQTSSIAARVLAEIGASPEIVYLDAAQDYDECLLDLRLYWNILKDGGCIIGDDYHPNWKGVMRAARVFSKDAGQDLYILQSKFIIGKNCSWRPSCSILAEDYYWDFAESSYKRSDLN